MRTTRQQGAARRRDRFLCRSEVAIAAVPVETFAGFRPARGRGGFKAEFDHLLDRMPDQILTDELF
jgi:hypothetical protein